MQPEPSVDLERLLKLRLVVARMGEMDRLRWWNSSGQLGPLGALALRRGLPRTYHFAQARSVFAVAAHRCESVFSPPSGWTLWRLPREIEASFEARWEAWIDAAAEWAGVFQEIAEIQGSDVTAALSAVGLVVSSDIARTRDLRTSAGGRAVALPEPFDGTDEALTRLALGFGLGQVGEPAVPYAVAAE